jgi:uncharacterized protein with PIN domain
MDTKTCSKCGETKPIALFNKQAKGLYGVKKVCKECHNYWYRHLVEERNKANWVRPTEGVKRCPTCKVTLPVMAFASDRKRADGLQPRCNTCNNALRKTLRIKLRHEVLSHYAGDDLKCACPGCGERTIEFLCIDHIDGGGHLHRLEIGLGSETLYKWLKRNNFPPGFQVLCANCNGAKQYHGMCPHEREQACPKGDS